MKILGFIKEENSLTSITNGEEATIKAVTKKNTYQMKWDVLASWKLLKIDKKQYAHAYSG